MAVHECERKQGKLTALIKADALCRHTLLITKNKKIFTEEYYTPLTQDVIETAKDIFICAWEANDIRVVDSETWTERRNLAKKSIRRCDRLMALMQLCRTVFHLDTKKLENWARMCRDARKWICAWHEGDCRRYAKFG